VLCLVAVLFVFIQTASAIAVFQHDHTGPHAQCCGLCQVGSMPAVEAAAVELSGLTFLDWSPSPSPVAQLARPDLDFSSSRAPPASLFSL
jgi:hypothetical protein